MRRQAIRTAERHAQPRYEDLHCLGGGRRGRLAPQRVDQPGGGDRLWMVDGQHGEHRAAFGAALTITACGGGADGGSATPAAISTAQYSKQAAALKTSIDDARSDYFHGRRARKAVLRQLQGVRTAYDQAAQRLAAVRPPAAAADLHRRLLALWRQRASELARLLSARHYRSSAISDLMYATDADTVTYNDIYTLPQ